MPRTEPDLVEAARRGDAAAFAELARAQEEIAFRTAFLVTRDASEAEEAAQDALVKAWRSLGRFRRGAPFRPWLLAIVANEARNRRRASARREAATLRLAPQAPRPGDAPSPADDVVAADERARLLSRVEALPDEQRLAVACRYFLDLGEAETAAVLGVRPGTVKSRVARGLDRLRETT